jgi:hypothetical protein
MTFAQLFASYWWLMFPIFGMVMAVMGMFQSEQRTRKAMDLIKSYVDQGKEPPADLMKLAMQQDSDWSETGTTSGDSRAWSFIVFAALAAGLGTGYYFIRAEEWAFAFLIGAVATGVMAVGALFILIFGRKKS